VRALRKRTVLGAFVLLVTLFAAGCAVVDQYSGRAVGYNVEAEQASQQAILLNIVRAYLRRPMQFTSVSTITGTASTSGTFGMSIPFGAGGAAYKTGTPSATISGGPTFTVPVLDTQEFYYGIMNPIPGSIFDLYIQNGYQRDLLFNLFIEKIVVHKEKGCGETQHSAECEFTFHNHAHNDVEIDLFQAMVGYLIELGLTTQPIRLPAETAAKSGSTSAKDKTSDTTPAPPTPYEFCFAPTNPLAEPWVPKESRCASAAKLYDPSKIQKLKADIKTLEKDKAAKTAIDEKKLELKQAEQAPSPQKIGARSISKVILANDAIQYFQTIAREAAKISELPANSQIAEHCNKALPLYASDGSLNICAALNHFIAASAKGRRAGTEVTLSVYVRSTENLIYYLGELARRQHSADPRIIQFRTQLPYKSFDSRVCDNQLKDRDRALEKDCSNIFVLNVGALAIGGNMSVLYGATMYSIPSDEKVGGYSAPVVEIVKQLLAMSSSAKSLPQTNVISVIGN
jgi:hypothetical protein